MYITFKQTLGVLKFGNAEHYVLQVWLARGWDGAKYFNVAAAINTTAKLPNQIADDETRIGAQEVKQCIIGQHEGG